VRGRNAVAVARRDVRTLVPFVSFHVAAKTICEGAQFARWLRYRCSETSFSSRLTTMAEAARHGRREQPGYFVCSTEFFPGREESPPSHQGQLRCGRRHLRSHHGGLARTALVEGNKVTPLENGDQIFPAMLSGIRSAQRTITFKNFLFREGKSLTPLPKRWRNARVPA
jgi:hypothetical protein